MSAKEQLLEEEAERFCQVAQQLCVVEEEGALIAFEAAETKSDVQQQVFTRNLEERKVVRTAWEKLVRW